MTDYEIHVDGARAEPESWQVTWEDRTRGIASILVDGRSVHALVEGSGSEWFVTIRGRRIPVQVRTWRERLLAEAESASQSHAGPTTVKATLPGLVVVVAVAIGDEVEAGAPLVTIEAMKMQNEVRAPRAGRVTEVSVLSGQAVATGAPLVRLE